MLNLFQTMLKNLREYLIQFPALTRVLLRIKNIIKPPAPPPKEYILQDGAYRPNPQMYSPWICKTYKNLYGTYEWKNISENKALEIFQKFLKHSVAQSIEVQPTTHAPQCFLDVSFLIIQDAKTGIQRVVRNLMNEFLASPPKGYHVEPVYAKYGRYYAARNDEPIDVFKGDIFLGLDLIMEWVEDYRETFQAYKKAGARIYFIVYDLLPLKYPQFFRANLSPKFISWLSEITDYATGVFCISKTIAEEFKQWYQEDLRGTRPFEIHWFHLSVEVPKLEGEGILDSRLRGNDAEGRGNDAKGCADDAKGCADGAEGCADGAEGRGNDVRGCVGNAEGPIILMVSTIEPRKGYQAALKAFEALWDNNIKIRLVIVGQAGWHMKRFIQKFESHPQKDKQLFWFDKANDAMLATLYKSSHGLLMASYCEGFGLPLIEAAYYNLPILARDIPVFQEVAGDHAMYFEHDENLSESLQNWVGAIQNKKAPESYSIPRITWAQSAQQIKEVL